MSPTDYNTETLHMKYLFKFNTLLPPGVIPRKITRVISYTISLLSDTRRYFRVPNVKFVFCSLGGFASKLCLYFVKSVDRCLATRNYRLEPISHLCPLFDSYRYLLKCYNYEISYVWSSRTLVFLSKKGGLPRS